MKNFEHVFDFRKTRKYKRKEKIHSLFVSKEYVPLKSQVRPHLTKKMFSFKPYYKG